MTWREASGELSNPRDAAPSRGPTLERFPPTAGVRCGSAGEASPEVPKGPLLVLLLCAKGPGDTFFSQWLLQAYPTFTHLP